MNSVVRKMLLSGLLSSLTFSAQASEQLEIKIGFLKQEVDSGPVLSNILPKPENAGLMGAELGIKDSNTTGRFLKQKYTLTTGEADSGQELIKEAQQQYSQGIRFFVTDAPADTVKQLSSTLAKDVIIFNAGSADDKLRSSACLSNVLHTLPSRAMLTDSLAQWLKAKRLNKVLVLTGPAAEDKAYSQAFKRAAKRFGLKIVAEKQFTFDADLRRTAQAEMPLFTQTKEYDVVLVADERGDFGEYVLYNTWYPRPVVGTQGLTPVAWHRVVEQWGAAQLQSRFDKLAKRWMISEDYAAWAAVRSVAEAVTRTNKADYDTVNNFIRSDQFELAGFKGRKLDYRDWSGQLRQPIPLVHPRSLVSQSPQEGFLHPKNELDTLGFDKPEVKCAK
ncbi:ABC transporter substrate-binding protein [Neptuniibacter sp.]|uniref:ABC transporter substrate-binding protein n=1 Tax=Neptuniibacter sp. TaxID=1962643 RepID=UPI00262FD9C2|nr:ABC transporter substrate-binding protein [Neptuniibacter sp.]MCP4595836.1 ABC transporter substrate-binding protein [Neptuniibacter sp.]